MICQLTHHQHQQQPCPHPDSRTVQSPSGCSATHINKQNTHSRLLSGCSAVQKHKLNTIKKVFKTLFTVNHFTHFRTCKLCCPSTMYFDPPFCASCKSRGSSVFPAKSLGFTSFGEIFAHAAIFSNPAIEAVTFCLLDGASWVCFCCRHSPI